MAKQAVYKSIASDLAQEIECGVHSGTGRLPSESQLCKRFGVSIGTVRNSLFLLRSNQLIMPAHGKGWMIQPKSQSPLDGKGLALLTSSNDEILPGLSEGLRGKLAAHGANLDIHFPDDVAFTDKDALHRKYGHCAGLVWFRDIPPDAHELNVLREAGMPFVCVGLQSHEDFDTICTDNFAAARGLTEYLIGKGHRRIYYLTTHYLSRAAPSFQLRMRGYEAAMRGHNLEPLVYISEFNNLILPVERTRLLALLERENKLPCGGITCFFGHTDKAACNAVSVLKDAGIPVPGRISAAGIGGNVERSSQYAASVGVNGLFITSAEEVWRKVGEAAFEALLRRIANPTAEPRMTLVPSAIIEGNSVRDLRIDNLSHP